MSISKVRDLLDRKSNAVVSFIHPNARALEAAKFMMANRIGSLLVQDEKGEPIGIITERDILANMSQALDGFAERTVAEVMTADPICGLPDDDINYITTVMKNNNIRHLPIVSNNKVVGLISMRDILDGLLEAKNVENRKLHAYLHLSGKL